MINIDSIYYISNKNHRIYNISSTGNEGVRGGPYIKVSIFVEGGGKN